MNVLSLILAGRRYLPVVGLVGLAVYHLAAKSDPAAALADLKDAADELAGVAVAEPTPAP